MKMNILVFLFFVAFIFTRLFSYTFLVGNGQPEWFDNSLSYTPTFYNHNPNQQVPDTNYFGSPTLNFSTNRYSGSHSLAFHPDPQQDNIAWFRTPKLVNPGTLSVWYKNSNPQDGYYPMGYACWTNTPYWIADQNSNDRFDFGLGSVAEANWTLYTANLNGWTNGYVWIACQSNPAHPARVLIDEMAVTGASSLSHTGGTIDFGAVQLGSVSTRSTIISGVNLYNAYPNAIPSQYRAKAVTVFVPSTSPYAISKTQNGPYGRVLYFDIKENGDLVPKTIWIKYTPTINAVQTENITLITQWRVFSTVQNNADVVVQHNIPVRGVGAVTVTTDDAINVSSYRADLVGTASFGSVLRASRRGFIYSTNSNLSNPITKEAYGSFASGQWTLREFNLTANTIYYYKAFVEINGTVHWASNTRSFRTKIPGINPESPTCLDFGDVPINSVTRRQSTFTWSYLKGSITATPPPGFRVKISPSSTTPPQMPGDEGPDTYPPDYGNQLSGSFTVYVWFYPTQYGEYNGSVTISSPGMTTKNLPVHGFCGAAPTAISLDADEICSTHFRANLNFASVDRPVTEIVVWIAIDPGEGGEAIWEPYSETGSWSGENVTWSRIFNNLLMGTTYHFKAQIRNAFGTSSIGHTWVETERPIVSVAPGTVNFAGCKIGAFETQTFLLNGNYIDESLYIGFESPEFKLSEDNVNFYSSLNVIPASCSIVNRTIYIRFTPSSLASYSVSYMFYPQFYEDCSIIAQGYGCDNPVLNQPQSTNVLESSATLKANVSDIKNSECSERGFRYSLYQDFHEYFSVSETSRTYGAGQYQLNIINLLPGHTYYYYGYAINEAGIGVTDTGSFITLPTLSVAPSQINFGPVAEGSYDVKSFQISGYGVEDDVEVSVQSGPFTVSLSSDSGFSNSLQIPIGRIDGNWTIYVKFSPLQKVEYSGSIIVSTDLAADQYVYLFGAGSSVPLVVDLEASNVSHEFAILTANLSAYYFSPISSRGFIVSRNMDFSNSTTYPATYAETPTGLFSADLTGLDINTLYYIKAFAENGIGRGESAPGYFNTLPLLLTTGLPVFFAPIQAGQISEPQSFTVEGIALDDDLIVDTTPPYEISLTSTRSWGTHLSISPDSEGNVSARNIWVRFAPPDAGEYICNIVVSSENAVDKGGQLQGDGIDFPSFSGVVANGFTHESAWLHATIEDNNSDLTGRGFSYSKNSDMSDSLYVFFYDTFPEGEMSYEISGLETRTLYYFRALAENSLGRGGSAIQQFTTFSLITLSTDEIEFVPVTFSRDQETLSYTVSGTGMDDDISINVTGAFTISLTDDGEFTDHVVISNVRGDIPPTPVYVRFTPTEMGIYESTVVHSADFALDQQITLKGRGIGLADLILPTVDDIGLNFATCRAFISDLHFSPVTEVGAVLSRKSDFADSIKVTLPGDYDIGDFNVLVENLKIYRKYFFKLFAINEAGCSYTEFDSLVHFFMTLPVDPPEIAEGNETAVAHDGYTIWWDDAYMDQIESFDIECWDPRTESLVYSKTVGNQNVGRIGEGYLVPGLHYDYRIRSDISEFSDFLTHPTTPIVWGRGANTIILGDSITYYIPPTDSIAPLPPFVHNNMWIDTNQDITQDMYLHVLWHPEEWECFCEHKYEPGTLAYYLRGEDIAIASRDSIIVYYPTNPVFDLDFKWVEVHSCREFRFDYDIFFTIYSDHARIGIKPNQLNLELDTLVVIILGPIPTKPVTLSSFTASYQTASSNVKLHWIVESETEMLGYNVYRNHVKNLGNALLISPLIDATNTSSTHAYSFFDNEVTELDSCYYWLQSLGIDGSEEFYGPVFVRINHPTDEEVPPSEIPTGLTRLYPNPFNPSIKIEYNLQVDESCRIDIYNIKGQKIKTLVDGPQKAGLKSVVWNGKDTQDRSCSSGVYIVNMRTNRCHDIRKVIMLK